jgi:multidrug resistance efflux pump
MFTPGHDTYDIPKEGRAFGILCETVGTVDGNARKTSIPHLNEGGPVTFTVEVSADGEKTVEGHFTAILPDNELYAEVHRAT